MWIPFVESAFRPITSALLLRQHADETSGLLVVELVTTRLPVDATHLVDAAADGVQSPDPNFRFVAQRLTAPNRASRPRENAKSRPFFRDNPLCQFRGRTHAIVRPVYISQISEDRTRPTPRAPNLACAGIRPISLDRVSPMTPPVNSRDQSGAPSLVPRFCPWMPCSNARGEFLQRDAPFPNSRHSSPSAYPCPAVRRREIGSRVSGLS